MTWLHTWNSRDCIWSVRPTRELRMSGRENFPCPVVHLTGLRIKLTWDRHTSVEPTQICKSKDNKAPRSLLELRRGAVKKTPWQGEKRSSEKQDCTMRQTGASVNTCLPAAGSPFRCVLGSYVGSRGPFLHLLGFYYIYLRTTFMCHLLEQPALCPYKNTEQILNIVTSVFLLY